MLIHERKARKDRHIMAVVVAINTPGGAVTAHAALSG